MSQYSEMMGSFIRTGNYPIEANYIFSSEEELKAFYADEMNNTLLHEGLLKIVTTEDNLTLYWIVQSEGKLLFKPLILEGSIDKLFDRLALIRSDLNLEISDRKESIFEIIGTDNLSDFQNGLDNLIAISNAVVELQQKSKNDTEILLTIVGSNERDLTEYLKTLDYNNLTDISNLLNKFFNSVDESDSLINTLIELLEFLKGFNYTDNLYQYLKDIVASAKHDHHNLLTEIDQTLVGIGLSGDGSFSPDQETNYLKNATSVMNALKTLDNLISRIKSQIIEYGYYDSTTESIILKFDNDDTQTIIPVSDLITEWETDNEQPNKVVELVKERTEGGGPDKLSADVRIDSSETNILKKVGNTLSVNGESSSITHNGQSLDSVLENINETLSTILSNIGSAPDLSNKFAEIELSINNINNIISELEWHEG